MKHIRHRLQILISFAATLGGLLVAVPSLIVVGPLAEPRYLPVVTQVRMQRQALDGTAVVFEVAGRKSRACTYLGASALAGARGELMEAVNIDFPTSRVPGATKPLGDQSFGTWRVRPVERGDRVVIQLRHRCHSLWDTTTQLGPWTVRP